MGRKTRDKIVYIAMDVLMIILAWSIFVILDHNGDGSALQNFYRSENFLRWLVLLPLGLVGVFASLDFYNDLYRQSRLSTLIKTTIVLFISSILIYFLYYSTTEVASDTNIFSYWFLCFLIFFALIGISRMVLLTAATRRLKSGVVSYNTLIIGGNENAVELYNEINEMPKKLGHYFLGFIDSNGKSKNELLEYLPKLGGIDDIARVVEEEDIEEIIVAIETSEHNKIKDIFNIIFDYDHKCMIKIIPDMYDILLGNVKMNHVYGAALIEIERVLMPRWQKIIKRGIDVFLSILIMVTLSPFYLYIALRVKYSSEGPVIYKQERIGQHGNPFMIYKYRSMYTDAEENGPRLSSDIDERCTPWGATMRKWRLDELPQMWNVLKGDMSLVGPRPEREYFIDLIMEEAPHFKHLLKVRPGITSWGQVKYGYASNVKQMIQRLKFDILYIENMSLALDFKILFYTILVILQGKGK